MKNDYRLTINNDLSNNEKNELITKLNFSQNRDTDSSFNESTRHPVTIEEKELESPLSHTIFLIKKVLKLKNLYHSKKERKNLLRKPLKSIMVKEKCS